MEGFPRRFERRPSRARASRALAALRAVAIFAALAAALPPPAAAQSLERAPGWIRLDTGLPYSRETLESYWVTLVRRPGAASPYDLATRQHSFSLRWDRGTMLVLDIPGGSIWSRDLALRHPQFALAENSEALRSWLRETGLLAARRCQAPVMKMKSAMADGGSRANIAVFARCSFD